MTNNLEKKVNLYHQYQVIIDQTNLIQHLTTSLASSLKTSLMLFPQPKFVQRSFCPQIKEVSQKITKMINRIKDSIENEFSIIQEVNLCLCRTICDFRKFIDLGRNHEQKSTIILTQLYNQLKTKEAEIKNCQSAIQIQAFKKHEQQWKQHHYLSPQKYINLTISQTYLELLKQCAKKIETQIRFQKRESDRILQKINKNLGSFKANLLEIWSRLFEKDFNHRSTKKCGFTSNPEDRYLQLQNAYVKKQRAIDQFDFSKFQGIKKKLRLLEQAQMSESRQYRSYSASGQKHEVIQESEIAEILQI